MRTHFFIIFLLIQVQSFAQEGGQKNIPDWENPAVFEKGQTDPHAFHIPYSNIEEARSTNGDGNFMLLNGKWKFKWVERPEEVPDGFFKSNFKTKNWDEISVPSNWQMEGYGNPKFRNIALTFENDPPNVPDYYNPVGCYKRTFKIPSEWKNMEIMLRFEGIKSASYVWINGKKAGYNQGGFEPAEYNITSYLKRGKNDISVQVIRFSDGSYLENQDMWRLSGIYRDVILYAQPGVHISDFYHTTDLVHDYKDAILNVELDIVNSTKKELTAHAIEVDILDEDHLSILNRKLVARNIGIASSSTAKVALSGFVQNPLKWSAEQPNLYTITYELKNDQGNTIEAFTERIGFREVELEGEVLRVNGIAVKLNGVNSHMHHPEHGQAVPYETMKKDLLIMKQYNINAVRTCHYPPSPEYLELADEIGMYIIDEVGDEAHNNIQLSYDSTFTEMYRDRSRKLVYRDRNHPSVIMWSAGNEAGSGPNIDAVIQTGKEIDPSRPAWMYGGNTFYIPYEDITGPRYWSPFQLKKLAERKILGEEDLRPSFMDEYLAATGNGLGGLDEYWELIWKYPRLLGGAIWDWISPGISTPLWITPDRSELKNDGAIMGKPVFVEGPEGRALSFSGHDDWIEFYRDPSLDITGKEITISFMVNPSEIPQPNTFISKGTHQYGIRMSCPDSLEFYIQSNSLEEVLQFPYFYFENNSRRTTATAAISENWYGQWHHVMGTYDGEMMRLYIDDVELAATKHSGAIAHSPFPLCIGRDAELHDQGEYSGRMSSMLIDEVKIFDRSFFPGMLKSDNMAIQPLLYLDFEEDGREGNFYAVGLGGRTYGIIWPDREIQPEIHQIKKSGQPVSIEEIDLEKGLFKITNRHHFTNLNAFLIDWSVSHNGHESEVGQLGIDLAPQTQQLMEFPIPELSGEDEYIYTISFKLKEDTRWAKAGHEVAWDQFILSNAQDTRSTGNDKVFVEENDKSFEITGSEFKFIIDKNTGLFTSLSYEGKNYLDDGPLFNIWRIPTANDIDPWGSAVFGDDKKMDGLGRSIDNQLRTLGMRNLEVQVDEINVYQPNQSSVILSVLKYWNSSNMRGSFECKEEYVFHSDGTIQIEFEVNPHGNMPDMFPKLGWQLKLPKSFSNVLWFGRGPFETYPDRKTGARIGTYSSSADDEYVPYIIPQEYGNHTDTRWLKVEDEEGSGLIIDSDELFNFSLHKYTTENLSRAMYSYQLIEASYNTLNIDAEMSGVGGTAIRQHQKYRVPAKSRKFTLTIKPY